MSRKISIIVAVIFGMILLLSNVYGRGLEIKANLEEGQQVFYTIVKSSQRSRTIYNTDTWTEMTQALSSYSYTTTGILLHKGMLTKYTETSEKPIDRYGNYITYQNAMIANSDLYNGYVNDTGFVEAFEKNDTSKLNAYFNDANNFITTKIESKNALNGSVFIPRSNYKNASLGESGAGVKIVDAGLDIKCILSKDTDYVITRYAIDSSVFDREDVKSLFNDGKIYVTFVGGITGHPFMLTAYDFFNELFQNNINTAACMRLADEISKLNAQIVETTNARDLAQRNYDTIKDAPGIQEVDRQKALEEWNNYKNKLEEENALLTQKLNAINLEYNNLRGAAGEENGILWYPYTKGVDFSGNYKRGYSAVNDYDNILNIENNDSNVYVQYQLFDRDGDCLCIHSESELLDLSVGFVDENGQPTDPDDIDSKYITQIYDKNKPGTDPVEKIILTADSEPVPYQEDVFEKFILEAGNEYRIIDTRKELMYDGKKYVLVQCLTDEEYNVFTKEQLAEIQIYAKSSYSKSKNGFLDAYSGLNKNLIPTQTIKYPNVKAGDTLVVRWAYIEMPTDLYVQYELMTLDNGDYRRDTINPFENRIVIKDGNIEVRKLWVNIPKAAYEYGFNIDEYVSTKEDGIPNKLKVEKVLEDEKNPDDIKDDEESVDPEQSNKKEKQAIKVKDEPEDFEFLDPNASPEKVKKYQEKIDNDVYQQYSLGAGSTYRLSAYKSFDDVSTYAGKKGNKFYLVEYLAEHLDEIVKDPEIKEMIQEKIYKVGKFPTKKSGNGVDEKKNCSRISEKLGTFIDAYKTLDAKGERKWDSIAQDIDDEEKGIYRGFEEYKEKDDKGKEVTTVGDPDWYDIYESYEAGEEQVIRLVYIEVPTSELNIYVQYDLLNYFPMGGVLMDDYVDLYEEDIITDNTQRMFVNQAGENLAKNIVSVTQLNSEEVKKKDEEGNEYTVTQPKKDKTTVQIEPKHLTDNPQLYQTQISSKVYQLFNTSFSNDTFYSVQVKQNYFELDYGKDKVKFYLIDYLYDLDKRGKLYGDDEDCLITPRNKTNEDKYQFIKQYIDKQLGSNRRFSSFAFQKSFKEAYRALGAANNSIGKYKKDSYGYSVMLITDKVEPINELTTDKITTYKDGKIYLNHIVRLIYVEIPDTGSNVEATKLLGLDIVGKLQFISMGDLGKTGKDLNKDDKVENLKKNNEFFNSTYSEETGKEDYIPTDEYITPYATDAYAYVIRALGWNEHNDERTFVKKVQTQRSYEYTFRWENKLDTLPTDSAHIIKANDTPEFSWAEENVSKFFYNLYNSSTPTTVSTTQTINLNNYSKFNNIYNSVYNEFSKKLQNEVAFKYQFERLPSVATSTEDNKRDFIKQIIYNYANNNDISVLPTEDSYIQASFKQKYPVIERRSVGNMSGGTSYYLYLGPMTFGWANELQPWGEIKYDGNVNMNSYNDVTKCTYTTGMVNNNSNLWGEGTFDFTKVVSDGFARRVNVGYYNVYGDYDNRTEYRATYYRRVENSTNTVQYVLKNSSYLYKELTRMVKDAINKYTKNENASSTNSDAASALLNNHDFYLKYWYYNTTNCPYASDSSKAYGDHKHGMECCRGFMLDYKNTNSYKYTTSQICGAVYRVEAKSTATYHWFVQSKDGDTLLVNSDGTPQGSWYSQKVATYDEYIQISGNETRAAFNTRIVEFNKAYEEWVKGHTVPKGPNNPYGSYTDCSGSIKNITCPEKLTMTNDPYYTTGEKEMKLESAYLWSDTVVHADDEVTAGKCASWSNEKVEPGNGNQYDFSHYGQVDAYSDCLPAYFKGTISGSVQQTDKQPRKCPICNTQYAGVTMGCTFTDITKLLALESSHNDTGNVDNCAMGYPYFKVASCLSAWRLYPNGEESACYIFGHTYTRSGYGAHDDSPESCRVYGGHIHNKECYYTKYLANTNYNANSNKNDVKKRDDLLTVESILDADGRDYSYWISPNKINDIRESIYFTDVGFTKVIGTGDQTTQLRYKYTDKDVTGINCSTEVIKGTKTSVRQYSGELASKYYSIANFSLYKISKITLHDNDITRTYMTGKEKKQDVKTITSNPTFKFTKAFDENKRADYNKAETNEARNVVYDNKTEITPSAEYNAMFETANTSNMLHSKVLREKDTDLVYNVKEPVFGKGDVPGSAVPTINYDLYADNINQDLETWVLNKYADYEFRSDRKNYLVANYKVIRNKNVGGYSVEYSNKDGEVTLINSTTKAEILTNENNNIGKRTLQTNNSDRYSLGNYDTNIFYLEVKVNYSGKTFTEYIMTSKAGIENFIKAHEKTNDYTIEFNKTKNHKFYKLIDNNNPNKVYFESEFAKLKSQFSAQSSAPSKSYVSTPGKYTGAGGKNGQYGDSFRAYDDLGLRATKSGFNSPNMFLIDEDFYSRNVTSKALLSSLFERKVQDSVEAMSNTEVLLRIGVRYAVENFYNDYFTFTKDYGETLYSDPTKSGYKPGDLDHHTRYTSDDSLLNRNKSWGWAVYTYNYVDGMKTYIAHNSTDYNKIISNLKNAAEVINPLNDPYVEMDGKDVKKDAKGKVSYKNTVYTSAQLIKNHAFEDYFEYNLQGRTTSITTKLKDISITNELCIKALSQLADLIGLSSENFSVNSNSELNKLFDLTDFENVGTELKTREWEDLGPSIKYANGNNITSTKEFNSAGGKTIVSYKGLEGTYYKNETPYKLVSKDDKPVTQSSEVTYTLNYENYTDTKDNKMKIDIYDWHLASFKTLSNLSEKVVANNLGGQQKGDGTGNGIRDFTFDVTYTLVDDGMNGTGKLYRYNFENVKGDAGNYKYETGVSFNGYTDAGNFTNYTQYGEVRRVNAGKSYISEENFTSAEEKYGRNITNDEVFSTTDEESTGSKINILNPMNVAKVEITTDDLLSHELSERDEIVLGKNTNFKITFVAGDSTAAVNYGKEGDKDGVDTKKYIKEYWIVCDFDIFCNGCVEHGEAQGWHGANTLIRCNSAGQTTVFNGKTTATYGKAAVGTGKRNITVYAISTNTPGIGSDNSFIKSLNGSTLLAEYLKNLAEKGQIVDTSGGYAEKSEIKYTGRQTRTMNQRNLYNWTINDAYHMVYDTYKTESTYRIFNFEITDFNDLSFKEIFRNGFKSSGNYFAGQYQWDYNILDKENNLKKLDSSLGTSNARVDRTKDSNFATFGGGYVLPVGPKSISGYVYGPKLGYKFSFDFKTTGYFDTTKANARYTTITPSYYYVSKDGKINTNVDLYYKDKDGKYIKFEGSGYKIGFKPNDGYRNLRFTDERDYHAEGYFVSEMRYIDISKTFTLDKDFMTTSFDGFMQTWYGEFKLPNSTIVVNRGDSPNNALTNGYIGVCFDIQCHDKDYVADNKELVVSYNKNDTGNILKKTSEEEDVNYSTNTTQWDYDGIFGIDSVGRTGDKTISKYGWTVSDADWQKIKSTVVLYETDLRADDDFE